MGWLADILDNAATLADMPEWGLSEALAGGKPTSNTGRVVYTGSGQNGSNGALQNLTGSEKAWDDAMSTGVTPLPDITKQLGNRGGNTGQNGSGSTTYSTPSYSAADLAGLDQSASILNNSLGRVDNQLDIALGNLGNQYNTSKNELQTGYNTSKNSYDTSTTQNSQQLRTNKNAITDQATVQHLRNLNTGLRLATDAFNLT